MIDYLDALTEPIFSESALVTIDVQCDVLDGQPFEVRGTSDILPKLSELTAAFRSAARPIVHIVRIYRNDGQNVDVCRRTRVAAGFHALSPNTAGVRLAPSVADSAAFEFDCELLLERGQQEISRGEIVMYKPRWGAFYQTRLEAWLREHAVSTVVFAGCNFPNCPRTSIYQASERDFRVVLASDAMSALYDRGLEELRKIGVATLSCEQIVTGLRRTSAI
jgi:nicotinamidase-related amidase